MNVLNDIYITAIVHETDKSNVGETCTLIAFCMPFLGALHVLPCYKFDLVTYTTMAMLDCMKCASVLYNVVADS